MRPPIFSVPPSSCTRDVSGFSAMRHAYQDQFCIRSRPLIPHACRAGGRCRQDLARTRQAWAFRARSSWRAVRGFVCATRVSLGKVVGSILDDHTSEAIVFGSRRNCLASRHVQHAILMLCKCLSFGFGRALPTVFQVLLDDLLQRET